MDNEMLEKDIEVLRRTILSLENAHYFAREALKEAIQLEDEPTTLKLQHTCTMICNSIAFLDGKIKMLEMW